MVYDTEHLPSLFVGEDRCRRDFVRLLKVPCDFTIVFTTLERSAREGNFFSLFASPQGVGIPASGPRSFLGGVPQPLVPGPFWEGYSRLCPREGGVPPSPVTGPVQSPVLGGRAGTPARKGQVTPPP